MTCTTEDPKEILINIRCCDDKYSASGQNLTLPAGANILDSEAVALASDGYVYPAERTESAIIANVGQTVFPTQNYSLSAINSNYRSDRVLHQNDNVFVAGGRSYVVGESIYAEMQLHRYKSTRQTESVTVASETGAIYKVLLRALPNNNLLLFWSTANTVAWGVYSPDLIPLASGGVENSSTDFDALALDNGGWAYAYTTANNLYLAIFDETGALLGTPSTVTSIDGDTRLRLAKLENGNIVVTADFNGSIKLSIYTPSGDVVSGSTAVLTSQIAHTPMLSILPDAIAIGSKTSSNTLSVSIRSYAGTAISSFSAPTTSGNTNGDFALTNDGSDFFVVLRGSFQLEIARLPVNGVDQIRRSIPGTTIEFGSPQVAALCDKDRVVIAYKSTGSVQWAVLNPSTLELEHLSVGSELNGTLTALPGPDFSFFLAGEQIHSVQVLGFKYRDASLVGVARNAAEAGSPVTISAGAGVHNIRPLFGAASRPFDHTGANVAGNKGSLIAGGAMVLKGL